MIKSFKELDKVRKILLIVIFFLVIITFKLGLKMGANAIFIKNYPQNDNDYTLKFISFLNVYQPYIAPYNYGNYYYQKGRYNDAYNKYKEALTHHIPNSRICKVYINTGLALSKLSELETDDEKAIELLSEADVYLNMCLAIPGDEDFNQGGNNTGSNNDGNNEGDKNNDIQGDKDNAKQLDESIKQQIDDRSQHKSQQDSQGSSSDVSQGSTTTPNPDNNDNASKKIEDVEKEAVKGAMKRDKTFQEQSYSNRGQYGDQTPGSGCIGVCW